MGWGAINPDLPIGQQLRSVIMMEWIERRQRGYHYILRHRSELELIPDGNCALLYYITYLDNLSFPWLSIPAAYFFPAR